jgi:hypothetical protein
MQWIDVAGVPGSGKSTLVDAMWPPRCIPAHGARPPAGWVGFFACVDRLLRSIRKHPSFAACESMIERSFAKMASVHASPSDKVYIQTGFVQRGLGIGWRMRDKAGLVEYYEKMPVSLGVVLLTADVETVIRRNIERGKDRSHMVPLMEEPLRIARETLSARGVGLLDLDTRNPVQENVERIFDFARRAVGSVDAETARYRHKG